MWSIDRIDSFLLNATSGRGVYVGDRLGKVLHVDGERLYRVSSDAETGVRWLEAFRW